MLGRRRLGLMIIAAARNFSCRRRRASAACRVAPGQRCCRLLAADFGHVAARGTPLRFAPARPQGIARVTEAGALDTALAGRVLECSFHRAISIKTALRLIVELRPRRRCSPPQRIATRLNTSPPCRHHHAAPRSVAARYSSRRRRLWDGSHFSLFYFSLRHEDAMMMLCEMLI